MSADIQAVDFELKDGVKAVLEEELTSKGFNDGTLYVGPAGAIPGRCFLILIGSGRAPFSYSSLLESFQSPGTARVAICEFIAASLAVAA